MRTLLYLLVQALLYYIACHLLTRKHEHVPGILRLFVTVLLMAAANGFLSWSVGHGWLTSALILVINFLILLVGLGIGLLRTILAAVVVFFLNLLLRAVFAGWNPLFC